jgi:hypothetical protein
MSRPVTEALTREARRLLDQNEAASAGARRSLSGEEVCAALALDEEDIDVLKAIRRGENVARADQALAAIRLSLEYSQAKPAQLVRHGVDIAVVDPYAEEPLLPGAELPLLGGQVVGVTTREVK